MSDIALELDAAVFAFDFVVKANDLKTDEGLYTAVLLSLFTDRQAEPGDVLPEGVTDRRGWWADAFPVAPGDKFGSRLWLLDRATNTPDTIARAEEYARESLQWMIADSVTNQIDVVASFVGAGWALEVAVHRPGSDPARFRFDQAWAAEAARIRA